MIMRFFVMISIVCLGCAGNGPIEESRTVSREMSQDVIFENDISKLEVQYGDGELYYCICREISQEKTEVSHGSWTQTSIKSTVVWSSPILHVCAPIPDAIIAEIDGYSTTGNCYLDCDPYCDDLSTREDKELESNCMSAMDERGNSVLCDVPMKE